jgi:hypothetical protein
MCGRAERPGVRSGECFFVRHTEFLGAGDPYGRLKRILRIEIDEPHWAVAVVRVGTAAALVRTER